MVAHGTGTGTISTISSSGGGSVTLERVMITGVATAGFSCWWEARMAPSQIKVGPITETTTNNARQLSRGLLGICHWREIKCENCWLCDHDLRDLTIACVDPSRAAKATQFSQGRSLRPAVGRRGWIKPWGPIYKISYDYPSIGA